MNFSRVLEIARVELRFNLKRPLFWFLSVLITLFAFGMSSGNLRVTAGDSTTGGKKQLITSMFKAAEIFSVIDLVLFSLFLAIVAGMPILRDEELKTSELLRSTPLKPKEYVFGKYLGVILVYVAAMVVQVGVTMLFNHAFAGAADAEFLGPLKVQNYVVPEIAFVLPMCLFFAAVSFSIGSLTKRPALVFLSPIVLLVAVIVFVFDKESATTRPWVNELLLFLDPSGYRWLNETWLRVDPGVDFLNNEAIGFDSKFVLSRLGLVAISLGLVYFTAFRFEARERRKGRATASPLLLPTRERIEIEETKPIPAMTARAPSSIAQFLAVLRLEAGAMLKHPALWLFVPLFALEIEGNIQERHTFLEASTLITPGIAAVGSLSILAWMGALLLLFFMVESLHREASERLSGIVYATPVGTRAMLFAKVVASSSVAIAVFVGCFLAFAIAILVKGRVPLSIGPFVFYWGILLLPTYLLWSAFVAAMFGLTGTRIGAYALSLFAIAFTFVEALFFGHMSWVFNWIFALSPITWSDFGALELNRDALIQNRVLVLIAAVLFTSLAVLWFPRTERDSTRTLLRLRPKPLLMGMLRLSYAIVPLLVLGGYLHHQIQRGFQGSVAQKAAKDYWRRNVQTYTDDVTPDLEHVDIAVDLFPERRELTSKGRLDLVNNEKEPMREILMTPGFDWRDLEWTLNGAKAAPENRAGLHILHLDKPLAPGERASVGFSFSAQIPHGFTKNGGGDMEFITPSSVVLTAFSTNLIPRLGFVEGAGVDEDNKSDSKEYPDDFYKQLLRSGFGSGVPMTVKTVISGPADFVLNGVGVKTSDIANGDRHTATWETEEPVRFFNVVAGKDLVETKGEGVALWHRKDHEYNLKEMMDALNGARKYFSEWFYPYPWKELKVTEFAGHASYAQGFPSNISFSEAIGFTLDSSPESNLAFLVTAHESAHQWWGNLLTPGQGPGTDILSEGMAHFSTALLIGQVKGDYERMEFLKRIEQKYADDRQVDSERPMVKIDGSKPGDTTCTYDKPGFVMYMLMELIGREAMLQGCHDFIAKNRTSRDYPALQDFIEHMRGYANDVAAYDAFADQWFFHVVVPRLKVLDAQKAPPSDGPWMVKGTLENRGTGRMKVALAATTGERWDDKRAQKPEYKDARKVVEIGAGEKVAFEIPCDFEPSEIVVDPDVKQLMLFRKEARAKLGR